ncbi:DMSO/selenate family reductase complex B subunit [Ferrimonas marina]|uniref:Anaerobic dimethyl sulfoxide reductase subunit B (DMSO reductase iron-sulfur subunit) n=1 Tax=Ferrimonas marina TaxID=299255 RepID=A0A1M5VH10_9GAMM|nr:DMSO/selenate family reductase complex B subunit [Ferrimonas marina]SHH74374.1 anaerobic dimethyl sulfoxide reductase subunit B (DMSO reductase iron-sulfur subunit) [Ferrimonas marina]
MRAPEQYGFYIDTSKCTGCKTCQIACKDKNDLPVGVNYRRVYEYGGGGYRVNDDNSIEVQDVYAYYTSISCNHCSKPACVKVCPTGAMHKRRKDGLVLVDKEACMACGRCHQACPYDAPQMDFEAGHMTKCDGCHERIAEGRLPVCVESCPMRALDFAPMSVLKARYPDTTELAPLPKHSLTEPNLLIKGNKHQRASGAGDGEVLNWAEGLINFPWEKQGSLG